MPTRSRLSGVCPLLLVALSCSGRVEVPDNSLEGAAGSMSAPSNDSSAGSLSQAGSSPSGAGPSANGGSGGSLEDPGDLPMGGANVEAWADATLRPTQGNGVTGSVQFAQLGDRVDMTVTLMGCPAGMHALHLHANAACGDNANAAGGHWQPQGDGIGDVSCGQDGSAQHSFTPPDGTWSIAGPASTNVLQHALVLHSGPNLPEPGGRIACGIPTKVE